MSMSNKNEYHSPEWVWPKSLNIMYKANIRRWNLREKAEELESTEPKEWVPKGFLYVLRIKDLELKNASNLEMPRTEREKRSMLQAMGLWRIGHELAT